MSGRRLRCKLQTALGALLLTLGYFAAVRW